MSITYPPRPGMTLTFEDEFDRATLNGDGYNWMTYFPWGARNQPYFHQSQLFVDTDYVTPTGVKPGINPHQMIADPTEPGDGILKIVADRTPAEYANDIPTKYTSGHINSANMFDFRYGYAEMRAKLPFGQGMESTFYLVRADQAQLGEIDINEHVTQWPHNLFSSVHYWNGQYTQIDKTVRSIVPADLSADFHTYGVDWQPDHITFYFDGQAMGSMVTPDAVKAPMYLIADFSVGGDWVGYPDSSTVFPNSYQIDYIKVFQDASALAPLTVTGTDASETLSGGDGADTISGGLGNDTILGGRGDDSISGGDGADRIIGNGGNDTIVGNGGADTLEGWAGNDLYVIDTGDNVYERANSGFDLVMTSNPTYGMTGNVEGVIFTGTGNESIVGTPLQGLYIGGAGNDTINAGGGDDTIRGGAGNDSLLGADGNDWIYGGAGNDTMVGGTGMDRYIFTAPTSASSDVVRTFRSGDDQIDLRDLGLTTWEQIQPLLKANASGYAVLTYGNETITIENVKPTALTSVDFVLGSPDAKQAPTGIKISSDTILETAAVGSDVGAFIGVDPDFTQAMTYTLTNDANGVFDLHGRVLTLAKPLDYAVTKSYQIAIQGTNEDGLSFSRNMTIFVGDVADGSNPPPPPPPPSGDPAGTNISGTSGADNLTGTLGVDTISGLDGNDMLVAYAGNDSLDGGNGSDTLNGGLGADTLYGAAGLDFASYRTATGKVALDMANAAWAGATGESQGDTLISIEGVDGSPYNDWIIAAPAGSRLNGLAGNDQLEGRNGNDTIQGGDGNDLIIGWGGNDSLLGQAGSDTFYFADGSGKDLVVGFAAGAGLGDIIAFNGQFSSFADVLAATTDRSGVTSPLGTAFTGTVITHGTDEIWLAGVSKAQLNADDFDFTTYQLTAPAAPPPPGTNPGGGTAAIVGTTGDDNLTGTANADSMIGDLGNDRLNGVAGNDTLDGGAGSDTLIGDGGADSLVGGAGLDFVSYVSSNAAIAIDMDNSAWAGAAGDAIGDKLNGIEGVEGSGFNDTIIGATAASRLNGGAGDDVLTGRTGNDTILGGDGNDRITGDGGNDSLNGQAGNDTFVFNAGAFGKDVIGGFSAGAAVSDVVEFHGQFANFDAVMAAAEQVSNVTSPLGGTFSGTVIHAGADEIWLANVNKASLVQNDFSFFPS